MQSCIKASPRYCCCTFRRAIHPQQHAKLGGYQSCTKIKLLRHGTDCNIRNDIFHALLLLVASKGTLCQKLNGLQPTEKAPHTKKVFDEYAAFWSWSCELAVLPVESLPRNQYQCCFYGFLSDRFLIR